MPGVKRRTATSCITGDDIDESTLAGLGRPAGAGVFAEVGTLDGCDVLTASAP